MMLRDCYGMSGADIVHAATRCRFQAKISCPCRRAERAYGAVILRACYAKSGTDIAYQESESDTRHGLARVHANRTQGMVLRLRYALSGTGLRTDLAYGATRLSGTGFAYAACPPYGVQP
eukprot:1085378-Rhodomonas_salina.2